MIEAPGLADLFGPGSRAEASVAGKATPAPEICIEVAGQIDRIAETASEVLVADFKTGAPCAPAETPAGYLVQMALYRAVLAPLWPGKRLRMLLIWTLGPRVDLLAEADLDAALAAFAAGQARPPSMA